MLRRPGAQGGSLGVPNGGVSPDGAEGDDDKATKFELSRSKLLLAVCALLGLALLVLQLLSSSHGSSAGLLPTLMGLASRGAHSRRKDYQLRYDRNRRTAASMQGSSYPPLNFSNSPPFTFCPTFGPDDELANLYGPDAILRTRTHLGGTERIRKVLKRAMSGLPVTIGVLGGSISSCHGLDGTPAHPFGNPIGPNCYPHRLFSWLNDVFPHPANELTNGALRRTGTSYFGFCSDQHLPDRVDIVIVEFDTEDPHEVSTLSSTDLLIRSLLLRPEQPAVIVLGHFSPQVQGEHGFAGPEIWHAAVAQFYDVPHLSVKGLLYESYLTDPHTVRNSYFIDPVLANSKGHEMLADTLIAYLESEVCLVWEAENYALSNPAQAAPQLPFAQSIGDRHAGKEDGPSALLGGKGLRKSSDAGLDSEDAGALQMASDKGNNRKSPTSASRAAKIPPFRIHDRPDSLQYFREIKPHCASANDLVNPLPRSIFVGTGWEQRAPKPEDEDERHYWYSDTPGSIIKIPIKVAAGDITVYYYKGPASEGWGTANCWVDDNTAGAVELKGNWERDYGQPMITQIDRGVTKGAHFVACELLKSHEGTTQFKIFGTFAT